MPTITGETTMAMLCPRDGTELQHVEIQGVSLDKCHTCDGIWCDNGEIERLKGVHRPEEAVETRYGNPSVTRQTVASYMRCPRCGSRLHRYRYTYARPVLVDRCENTACYGIWLDKGELDAVLAELEEIESLQKVRKPSSMARALAAFLHRFSS